jgi:hypothetical protein
LRATRTPQRHLDLGEAVEVDLDVAALIAGPSQKQAVVRLLAELARRALRDEGGPDDADR